MRLFYFLSALVFPPKCVLCSRILTESETDLCHSCRADTPDYSPENIKIPYLAQYRALWYYEGTVRSSLLRFKFRNARSYAQVYGRLIAMRIMQNGDSFDALTWAPISRLRKWRRGYDQMELVAQATGKELGIAPVRTLKKVRHNPPQSGLRDASARRANVLGVYQPYRPEQFVGKRVLLLDDVITTGATASECARVLLTAGAQEVSCFAVAAASHKRKNSR